MYVRIFDIVVDALKIWKLKERKQALTVQNDSGRKNMLTKVRSLTFSPSRVDARLSMTALALKSYTRELENIDYSRESLRRPGELL